jgi:hypothetical protein
VITTSCNSSNKERRKQTRHLPAYRGTLSHKYTTTSPASCNTSHLCQLPSIHPNTEPDGSTRRSCAAVWRQGIMGMRGARSAGRQSAEVHPPRVLHSCHSTGWRAHSRRAARRASQAAISAVLLLACGAAAAFSGGRRKWRRSACRHDLYRRSEVATHVYDSRAEAGGIERQKSCSSCCVARLALSFTLQK